MIAHIGSGPEPNSVLLFDSCNWNVGLASFIYDHEFAYNRNQLLDILPLMHARVHMSEYLEWQLILLE